MYRVLVPVDPNETRARAAAEAVTSLPYAAESVEAIVLSVFKERKVADLDGGRVDSEELFKRVDLPESIETAVTLLEDADIAVTVRREHGDPASTIVEVANEADVDNVIIAGRKRSPVGKAVFGSVTQSVVLESPIPVTVVGAQ